MQNNKEKELMKILHKHPTASASVLSQLETDRYIGPPILSANFDLLNIGRFENSNYTKRRDARYYRPIHIIGRFFT